MTSITEILSSLRTQGNYRQIPKEEDCHYIDLSSNDYLGLALRWKDFLPRLNKEFPDCGFSSSASRLLSSHQSVFTELENLLKTLYQKEVLLFNSGYHANTGLIGALSTLPSTLFVCDKLVHASIIDGLKISGAVFKRFPHNNLEKAEKIIRDEYPKHEQVILVVESIYSMEGSVAPLSEFCRIKELFPNLLIYLDEAHAIGVRGKTGLGLAEELNLINKIDFIVATFGKALASVGAFVATSPEYHDFFVNFSRSFIFSTALPPVNIAWSFMMMKAMLKMTKERRKLIKISKLIRDEIQKLTGETVPSSSQIIPLITGDSFKAVKLARKLKENWNIMALPIRRPTVPPGKECVRLSLSSSLNQEDVQTLLKALDSLTPLF